MKILPSPLQRRTCGLLLLAAAMLAGCSSGKRSPAPIEDRTPIARSQPAQVRPAPATVSPAVTAVEPSGRPVGGTENAGRPGYYTVRSGDTLIRIALDSGQNWRDLVRWNNLDNPNLIEVGQVLRITPPVAVMAAATPPATPSAEGVVTRPVGSPPVAATPVPPVGAAPRTGTATAAVQPGSIAAPGMPGLPAASAPAAPTPPVAPAVVGAPAPAPLPAAPAADEEIAWAWPAPGNTQVVAGFDEARNKGIGIAGRAGDPVLASADGRVVYAGAGLRGYGNLIILKHNNTYLTAYAHNQALLVKEDQTVRKGQRIAEMGSSDADRVKLHFEIRRQGRPVDPARFLKP